MASTAGERIYRARRTILQMLRDRGYMVDSTDVDESEEGFFEKFTPSPQRDALTLLVQKRDDPTDSIFVFWPMDPKVGVKPIKRYMERMNEEQVKRAIMVVQQNLTAFAKQALSEIQAQEGLTIEQFQESELLVNITEHVLVPQHMVLTKEEKIILLQRYKMKEGQLPRIQQPGSVAAAPLHSQTRHTQPTHTLPASIPFLGDLPEVNSILSAPTVYVMQTAFAV